MALYTKHDMWDIFCCAHPSCVLGPGPSGSLQRAGTCSTGRNILFVESPFHQQKPSHTASMGPMLRLSSRVTHLKGALSLCRCNSSCADSEARLHCLTLIQQLSLLHARPDAAWDGQALLHTQGWMLWRRCCAAWMPACMAAIERCACSSTGA